MKSLYENPQEIASEGHEHGGVDDEDYDSEDERLAREPPRRADRHEAPAASPEPAPEDPVPPCPGGPEPAPEDPGPEAPPPAPPLEGEASSASSSSSDDSSSSSGGAVGGPGDDDEIPPPPPARGRGMGRGRGRARGRGRGHGDPRAIRFGPWLIAPVERNGAVIGWGATCRRHTNSWEPHIVCKRQLAFGGLSEAECRTRMKMWLLAGMDIPEGEDDGRQQHFAILPRDFRCPCSQTSTWTVKQTEYRLSLKHHIRCFYTLILKLINMF